MTTDAQRGDFGLLTDDEKVMIRAAILLLENATSNSMNPRHRQSWNEDREVVLQRLKELLV